jgi:hypothetical protein
VAAASWPLAEAIRPAEARLPCGTILVHLLEKPAACPGGAAGGPEVPRHKSRMG